LRYYKVLSTFMLSAQCLPAGQNNTVRQAARYHVRKGEHAEQAARREV